MTQIWIEKTIVEGRQDRIDGDRALGKALWSPQRDKRGADIYKNMRSVREGDLVLHLIDNKKISGVSLAAASVVKETGIVGTDWEGPAYLIKLKDYEKLIPSIEKERILSNENRSMLKRVSESSEVFYTSELKLRQGAYLTPCPIELLQVINKIYQNLSSLEFPMIGNVNFSNMHNTTSDLDLAEGGDFINFALRTKPFVILAGLSGTGKSRITRSLAYQFNNISEDRKSKNLSPSNYQMIKVKPNWHDSSELLGYESRISGKDRFISSDFIRFIIKAWQHPDTPFFLCLDEMNLAPVEQYFAEYLSVIESRRLDGDGEISTDSIVNSSLIKKYAEKQDGVDQDYDLWNDLELSDKSLQNQFTKNGLTLPANLIVMGTVNMDETTHSFSRKVLDRAMTIEMNEINLESGLDDSADEWRYPENPLPARLVIAEKTHGFQVYEDLGEHGKEIIKYLNKINEFLENSPFKIAYRVRDEFLLYAYNYSLIENKPDTWLGEVLDKMTLMKILPRIEGDEEKTKVLEELITLFEKRKLNESLRKAKEMNDRRNQYHYTSFWT